jgi:hypothetical protein
MFDLTPSQLKQVLALLVLAIAMALVIRSLIVRDRKKGGFSFEQLLMDDKGKSSSARAIALGAFGVTTWGLVYALLTKDNSIDFFIAYISAWVAAKSADAFANRPPPKDS